MKKHEILLGLTTTPKSDWRGKVEEMKKFGIKKIALFPTFLEIEQRKELYALLETIEGLEIPHVHLRSDMKPEEVLYLAEKFKVGVFNIHAPHGRYKFDEDYSLFANRIYIENTSSIPTHEELAMYAGLCIDFSHWEMFAMQPKSEYRVLADEILELAKKYPIGCCHVSAIDGNKTELEDPYLPGSYDFSLHWMEDMTQMEYMKKYADYLPQYVSIELENSFAQQLEAKAYLEKLLGI